MSPTAKTPGILVWNFSVSTWIARLSMLQHKHEATDTLRYRVILEHVDGGHLCRYVDLKIHVGPGDNWEPVITIMLPNED